MKVLIAEDDEIIRRSLLTSLRHIGHDPIAVTDADAAIEAIDREDCQFVIADARIKGVNCLELCRTIRRHGQDPYVYVILLVDHYRSQEMTEGILAGVDDFLTKPLNDAELIARVRYGERIVHLNARTSVIFALARIVESRKRRNSRHLERLQNYCRCLAELLREEADCRREIDSEFIRLLFQMSALHDIGNLCIPSSILLKPGRLNKEEFSVVKTHPMVGAVLLDAVARYYPGNRLPRMARDIVIAHHERWDGLGYPLGLAGANIPLAARIVAVADIYDALTSQQVYREAVSHAAAREIIVTESGSHLDPTVVKAFLRAEPKFMKVRRLLCDGCTAA